MTSRHRKGSRNFLIQYINPSFKKRESQIIRNVIYERPYGRKIRIWPPDDSTGLSKIQIRRSKC